MTQESVGLADAGSAGQAKNARGVTCQVLLLKKASASKTGTKANRHARDASSEGKLRAH